MSLPDEAVINGLLEQHDREFRNPAEITGYWQGSDRMDQRVLEFRTEGGWWETLGRLNTVMLVTREYEHLLMALRADEKGQPDISLMRMPHPSGLAVDRERGVVHVACTRNPNQIYDLMPADSLMPRLDIEDRELADKPLVPVRTRFMPGCLYIHDLAMINGSLHANSVGQNAVVRLEESGRHYPVWWPRCIETNKGPTFGQNHLQLNSIAAGNSLNDSYFSASTDEMTEIRPGDPAFPVDRRGVIFSGATREPMARGLTRPHSARMHADKIWVDNSGYGEVGFVEGDGFQSVTGLSGWTRGLCFVGTVAFVGTSRILPRFKAYAPGLDLDTSVCGVHAVDTLSGQILGSIIWPYGNQIFSVESVPADFTSGLPFRPGPDSDPDRERSLFYAFQTRNFQEE
jgi:uncharacterized protein (TIGR03032 family)